MIAITASSAIGAVTNSHRQALAGASNRRIARNLRTHGKRALALLERGIG